MKTFFLILGWVILLAVLLINRLVQPMSDTIVIVLCVISTIFFITGIWMKKSNNNK